MSVAKVIEISSQSEESFDDAIREGIRRASKTVDDIKNAWVAGQQVDVRDGRVVRYRVNLRVTFVLSD